MLTVDLVAVGARQTVDARQSVADDGGVDETLTQLGARLTHHTH